MISFSEEYERESIAGASAPPEHAAVVARKTVPTIARTARIHPPETKGFREVIVGQPPSPHGALDQVNTSSRLFLRQRVALATRWDHQHGRATQQAGYDGRVR